MQRKGITAEYAQREAHSRSTLIAALLVKFGKQMVCYVVLTVAITFTLTSYAMWWS